MTKKTWLSCGRDDLHGIPFMESHGFTPEFSYNDKRNGRNTPLCLPCDAVGFIKNDLHCWKFMQKRDGDYHYIWQTAILDNNYFTKHKSFDTLEEIVKHYL